MPHQKRLLYNFNNINPYKNNSLNHIIYGWISNFVYCLSHIDLIISVLGRGFAKGTINFGGLLVKQVTTFKKKKDLNEGPDNIGITSSEPIGIPRGFSCLGSFAQPNNIHFLGMFFEKDVSNNTSKKSLKSLVD